MWYWIDITNIHILIPTLTFNTSSCIISSPFPNLHVQTTLSNPHSQTHRHHHLFLTHTEELSLIISSPFPDSQTSLSLPHPYRTHYLLLSYPHSQTHRPHYLFLTHTEHITSYYLIPIPRLTQTVWRCTSSCKLHPSRLIITWTWVSLILPSIISFELGITGAIQWK